MKTNNNQNSTFEQMLGSEETASVKPIEMKNLVTEEPPREVLAAKYPTDEWPISGGWGYTKDDAVVVDIDNESDGVEFEHRFLECRTRVEAANMGLHLAQYEFSLLRQSLVGGDDDQYFDKMVMRVTAHRFEDYHLIMDELITLPDNEEGRQRERELLESIQIQFDVVGWFDISKFFGKF